MSQIREQAHARVNEHKHTGELNLHFRFEVMDCELLFSRSAIHRLMIFVCLLFSNLFAPLPVRRLFGCYCTLCFHYFASIGVLFRFVYDTTVRRLTTR